MQDKYVSGLWNDPYYGGPVWQPIKRTEDSGDEIVVIDNGLQNLLYEDHAARKDLSGVYKIKNI